MKLVGCGSCGIVEGMHFQATAHFIMIYGASFQGDFTGQLFSP